MRGQQGAAVRPAVGKTGPETVPGGRDPGEGEKTRMSILQGLLQPELQNLQNAEVQKCMQVKCITSGSDAQPRRGDSLSHTRII